MKIIMKKQIILVFAVLLGAAGTMAQEPVKPKQKKSPEERADHITSRMTEQLGLSAEQQVKVKAAILERESKRDADIKERKAQMEKMDQELKTVLTPEQYEKYKKKREEMKERRKQSGAAPMNRPAPARAPAER
jgi:Spy/CpxP family protein refolding chaperone